MPAESLGAILGKPNTTHEVPSVELRFILRNKPFVTMGFGGQSEQPSALRILQQLWVIYHHPAGAPAHPTHRETEWRDVPLVESE